MLVKLYNAGIQGRKWNFLNELYKGLESFVKWEGRLSEVSKGAKIRNRYNQVPMGK